MLTNPKLKGKVTLLTEMADTVGLVMPANGDDPTNVTDAGFNKAIDTIKRPSTRARSGSSPATTTRRCSPRATSTPCFAWSGDMVQLQADHPGLKWVIPDTGGMIWTDNMLIPKGGHVYTASVLMNWYYDPKIAAAVADYVNYICPVVGADKVLAEDRPGGREEPAHLPDGRDARAPSTSSTRRRSTTPCTRRSSRT